MFSEILNPKSELRNRSYKSCSHYANLRKKSKLDFSMIQFRFKIVLLKDPHIKMEQKTLRLGVFLEFKFEFKSDNNNIVFLLFYKTPN